MDCGSLKVMNLAHWSSPLLEGVKFNIDDTAKAKPRSGHVLAVFTVIVTAIYYLCFLKIRVYVFPKKWRY